MEGGIVEKNTGSAGSEGNRKQIFSGGLVYLGYSLGYTVNIFFTKFSG